MAHHPHIDVRYVVGTALDDMLAKGYHRSGRDVINDYQIFCEDTVHNVYWLRYNLALYTPTATHRTIIKKCSGLTTTFSIFQYDEELEVLYKQYNTQTKYKGGENFFQYLYYLPPLALHDFRFQSYCTTVYDGEKRIAVGIIDAGSSSIAGIANIFLPEYKKYSLGKYMILYAMQTALANGLTYYYPGYISPTYPYFDYKLFMGKECVEVYDVATKQWLPYSDALIGK
jgi:arginine-tRNA-protein transferase